MSKISAEKIAGNQLFDYKNLFEALPGLYLILTRELIIMAVSDAYLNATMTNREEITGKHVFDVFPDNPDDKDAHSSSNVRASFMRVLQTGQPDTIPIQKYDIRKPESEGGGYEVRYWTPINSPLFDRDGEVTHIVHRVEDATDFVKRQEQNGLIGADIFQRTEEVAATNRSLRKTYQETTQLLAAIVESSRDAIISTTRRGIVTSWNSGAKALLGWEASEAIGRHINFIMPSMHYDEETHIMGQIIENRRVKNFETARIHKSGKAIDVSLSVSPIHNERGDIIGASKVIRDTSDRKDAEEAREQLRQSQKMESLGQLTGGIAHDFNNLLAVIVGNLDFLMEKTSEGDALRKFIEPSLDSALHGAELTQRLLAFSRKQALQPKVISLNELLLYFSKWVERILGERVSLITSLEKGIWNVSVDPGMLQDALLNLSVNARDAMPRGGKLIYETRNITLDEEYAASNADVVAGEYVMLAVSDTGEGMPPHILEKAFEPFFTTKDVGKGSGLGLSMVYGFVKQSAGHIKLYSEPGQGTSIKLYLPRSLDILDAPAASITSAPMHIPALHKKVLLVEDNPNVLQLTSGIVRELGYYVITAENADIAMTLIKDCNDIDLLITDVMLPGTMNGPSFAQEACKIIPGLKVIFISGYAEQAIIQSGLIEEGMHFITKPFRKQQLASKITQVLN